MTFARPEALFRGRPFFCVLGSRLDRYIDGHLTVVVASSRHCLVGGKWHGTASVSYFPWAGPGCQPAYFHSLWKRFADARVPPVVSLWTVSGTCVWCVFLFHFFRQVFGSVCRTDLPRPALWRRSPLPLVFLNVNLNVADYLAIYDDLSKRRRPGLGKRPCKVADDLPKRSPWFS